MSAVIPEDTIFVRPLKNDGRQQSFFTKVINFLF